MVKRYLLTGLVAGFLSISSTLYAGESEIILKDNTTASGLTVKEETANTTIARFRGDGKVGIGTTDPQQELDVSGNIIIRGNITIPSENYLLAGLFDSRFWNPGQSVGELKNMGKWGPAMTYLAYYNGGWKGTTWGTAAFLGVSEGQLSFANANSSGEGAALTWKDRFVVDKIGNVGIGTKAPRAQLAVASGDGTDGVFPSGAWAGMIYNTTDSATSNGLFVANRWAAAASTAFQVGGLYSGVSQSFFMVNGIGNVGIGTTAPTEKLEVLGNIKASGAVTQGSSREIKKNISYLSTQEAMEALEGLNPVRFEYKADASGEEHLGFIAENVPELVAEQDRKHLNPMDLTAVLAKVIQEQQKMLRTQKEAMDVMKHEIDMLKSAMNYGVKGL